MQFQVGRGGLRVSAREWQEQQQAQPYTQSNVVGGANL